ncbi:MAG TPA: response regulator [Mariprofundaceae bacterium]|nr:response regulator [Mariprofundaceae bacterium]
MFDVVDDATYMQELLVEMLGEMGYEARTFTSAFEYLDFVHSDAFTEPLAVISDVRMPQMGGYELMQSVQEIHPKIRFVMMTGESDIRDEYRNHACMYLGKPFDFNSLTRAIEAVGACASRGPSPELCRRVTHDHEKFDVEGWSCPHSSDDAESVS